MIEYIYIESNDLDKQVYTKQLYDVLTWSLLMNHVDLTHDYLIMWMDAEIIGYVKYKDNIVKLLEIKENYRRSGLGSLLLMNFEYNRKLNGYEHIKLNILDENVVKFYKSLDYIKVEDGLYIKKI